MSQTPDLKVARSNRAGRKVLILAPTKLKTA